MKFRYISLLLSVALCLAALSACSAPCGAGDDCETTAPVDSAPPSKESETTEETVETWDEEYKAAMESAILFLEDSGFLNVRTEKQLEDLMATFSLDGKNLRDFANINVKGGSLCGGIDGSGNGYEYHHDEIKTDIAGVTVYKNSLKISELPTGLDMIFGLSFDSTVNDLFARLGIGLDVDKTLESHATGGSGATLWSDGESNISISLASSGKATVIFEAVDSLEAVGGAKTEKLMRVVISFNEDNADQRQGLVSSLSIELCEAPVGEKVEALEKYVSISFKKQGIVHGYNVYNESACANIFDSIFKSGEWSDGQALCEGDFEFTVGDKTLVFHSSCGVVNNVTDNKFIVLDPSWSYALEQSTKEFIYGLN